MEGSLQGEQNEASPSRPIGADFSPFTPTTNLWFEANPMHKSWLTSAAIIADVRGGRYDLADRQKAADDLLDGLDAVSASFSGFDVAERIVILILRTLKSDRACFVQEDPQNVIRRTMVRFLHRILQLEVCKSFHEAILVHLLHTIETENEENGIHLLRTLMEIIKIHRQPVPGQQVSSIFAHRELILFVTKMCRRWTSLPLLVAQVLELADLEPPVPGADGAVDHEAFAGKILSSFVINVKSSSVSTGNPIVILPKTSSSLKFLAESVMIIMFSQSNMRQRIEEAYPSFSQDALFIMVANLQADRIEERISSLEDQPNKQARVTGAWHEFMLTYCKVPQLFAYATRHFCKSMDDANAFGDGCLKLFAICPKEIVWGRRDILGAIKHIANTDWKIGLVPFVPQLLDLDNLLGPSQSVRDLLKATAVSVAMDVFNFVKSHLKLATFDQVITLCISYFSDRSIGISHHLIILRTMTATADTIILAAKEEKKLEEGRLMFIRILSMLALRLKVMVRSSLPLYKSKLKSAAAQGTLLDLTELVDHSGLVLTEQRALLRHILTAIRSLLIYIRECSPENQPPILPEDLRVLTRLCKYAVRAAELFIVGNGAGSKAGLAPQAAKIVEKEYTENLADAMKAFPFDVYRDIFQHIFGTFVELFKDEQLQQVLSASLNCLIPYTGFSGITTTTMLDVGMSQFSNLAESNNEYSASVLKIFKILFGAVSLYPKEVEQYFKPLLHKIFHQGFHLCMRAKDPMNILLMFRAFFRAMGGGGHEVLYHDFLPNLPMILQVLCTFHSQRQKPAYRDIFIELCLIVPVRLSTLMPHISLLAPAILTAMQGPPSSSSQGLRTLELCVDNMSGDYLYEQLEPVKKELMKALWSIMLTGNPQMQAVALRFLGKMCGHALKCIREPQQLHPKVNDDELGPCIILNLPGLEETLQVPIFRTIEEAYKTLLEQNTELSVRNGAWNVIQSYLLGIIRPDPSTHVLENILEHQGFKQTGKTNGYSLVTSLSPETAYVKCVDEKNRTAAQICLQGLMVAAATKDFRKSAMPLLAKFVRHFSLMAIVQQGGAHSKAEVATARDRPPLECIDPYVVLDAISVILGHEEPAISKTGDAGVILILETLKAVYEDLKFCVGLPFLNYLFEKLHAMCYEKVWCSKAGALNGISPLIDYLPLTWTIEMSVLLVRALMFVLRDSFQNMTYGTIDATKELLVRILTRILGPLPEDLSAQDIQSTRQHAITEITKELIMCSTSVVEEVRNEAMNALELTAKLLNQSLSELLQPHERLIHDFVPPKRPTSMKAYQMSHQTALLDANRFFVTNAPNVAKYDPGAKEDMDVVHEILMFLKQDDKTLQENFQCFDFRQYHPISFLPYRISAYRFVSVFSTFPAVSTQVHKALFDTLVGGSDDLLDVVCECLKKFASETTVGENVVVDFVTTVNNKLQQSASWTKDLVERLSRLQTIYPQHFNEDMAHLALAALPAHLDSAVMEQKEVPHVCDGVKKCATMLTLIKQTASQAFVAERIPFVLETIMQTEQTLMSRNGRTLTNALCTFLQGHGTAVVEWFFEDGRVLEGKWTAYFEKLLKAKDDLALELKDCLTTQKVELLTKLISFSDDSDHEWHSLAIGIRIIYLLTKKEAKWLGECSEVTTLMRAVWAKPSFAARLKRIFHQSYETWEIPVKFLVLLMVYVRMHPEDLDALFEMAKHSHRSLAEGNRWRQFVEFYLVLHLSPVSRRTIFLKWLDMVKSRKEDEDYLADIAELIVQPVLKQQFQAPAAEIEQMINDRTQASAVQGNMIAIALQTLLSNDLKSIYFVMKMSDGLRTACLKLLSLFLENIDKCTADVKIAAPTGQLPLLKQLDAKASLLATQILLRKDSDHIQVDTATVFQAQHIVAVVSGRLIAIPHLPPVLRSLFTGKRGQIEPRSANKQAIDILVPNIFKQPDQSAAILLCAFLKKALTEDLGNLVQICVIYQTIIRHRNLFFVHRHHFVTLMWSGAQKLGLSSATSLDFKRTAVDVIECIVFWEAQRKNLEVDYGDGINDNGPTPLSAYGQAAVLQSQLLARKRHTTIHGAPKGESDKQLEPRVVDGVANILLRLAFMFGEQGATESLGRKCIKILKFFMRRDMHVNADLKLQWLDRILMSIDSPATKQTHPDQNQPGAHSPFSSVCLALEALTLFIPVITRTAALSVIQDVSASLIKVALCNNARVAKCMNQLLSVICDIWAGDPVSRTLPPQLDSLYSQIIKVIHEGLVEYQRMTPGSQVQIFCTLMLLKATIPKIPTIIERFLTLLANVTKKIVEEHLNMNKLGNNQAASIQDGFVSAELVVIALDVIKFPGFLSAPSPPQTSHRTAILGVVGDLIARSLDVRVHRALIRIFSDWLSGSDKSKTSVGGPSSSGALGTLNAKTAPVIATSKKTKKKKEDPEQPESEGGEKKTKKKKATAKADQGQPNTASQPSTSQTSVDELQLITPRELGMLILKLQVQIEKKFSDDTELQLLYTNMIYKIFSSEDPKLQDMQQRLMNAWLYGMRHPDPEWRKKFYKLYERNFPENTVERLNCLFTSINWDACQFTNYISFCVNSLLGAADNLDSPIAPALHNVKLILPVSAPQSSEALQHHSEHTERTSSLSVLETISDDNGSPEISSDETLKLKELSIGTIVERVFKLNDMIKGTTVDHFVEGCFQLCHTRTQLANDMWVVIVPQLWKLLNQEQKDQLVVNYKQYLMTLSHSAQRDLVHFPIQAMWDAMSKCEGICLKLHPMSVLYLGERQNLWYRSAMHLEELALPPLNASVGQKGGPKGAQQSGAESDSAGMMNQLIHGVLWSTEECLQKMYAVLGEDDFSTAVWQLRGTLTPKSEPQVPRPMVDFRSALGYERQGMYFEAKESYEKAMDTFMVECRDKPAHESGFGELQVLTERYTDILKQLNQWPAMYNVAISEGVNNPCMALESAWHQDLFDVIPVLMTSADKQCPPREELNMGFCKSYYALQKVLKEGMLSLPNTYKEEGVDRMVEVLQQCCIKMWKQLPRVGSGAHRSLIEMATRVADLKELLNFLPNIHSPQGCSVQHVLQLKNMVKNWKVRVPAQADDLRFWGEIADFREKVLTHVVNLASEVQHSVIVSGEVTNSLATFPILSIHTISQNYFTFAKAARAQQLPRFASDILNRVQSLPVVPLMDCFERVKQYVQTCLALFDQTGEQKELQLGLDAIDNVTMTYFTKEMHAELFMLKSQICSRMNNVEDEHRFISTAVQTYENCFEGWMRYGDYYSARLQAEPTDLMLAKQAVTAYIFGSRSPVDAVARECCAKVVALLNLDDSTRTISSGIEEAVQCTFIIPNSVLVFWIPQLIHLMMREETAEAACTMLIHVAKQNPQPVFLHVRTYYYQMKAVHTSRDLKSPMGAAVVGASHEAKTAPNKRRRQGKDTTAAPSVAPNATEPEARGDAEGDGSTIRATPFINNCVRVMKAISDTQPTVCNALENFANQIFNISMAPERWYEELHAHLIQALKRCYALAFENKERVMHAKMTPSMLQYMTTIVRSFGTGVYQEPGSGPSSISRVLGDVASEAITKRAQNLLSSADYMKLKKDFCKEFDMALESNNLVQTMISKLKKWIRSLEKQIRSHTNHSYLDVNHRPLINFTNLTADMELPGDYSMQRNYHVVKVVQILPRMDVVFKHNLVCHRLYFVNNVGEIVPYLIVADNSNNLQGRKEERILQMFMAMNPILDDFPEASRRALKYYVPRITPVAPAVRLMEDSQTSICVFDIYKKFTDKKNIDTDTPIMKFYEKLVANTHKHPASISPQSTLRDSLKEIQAQMVPLRVLKDHFIKMYPTLDEYFLFRRTMIRSHAILCLAEYLLRLTKTTPDMMYVHTETGVEGIYSYTFDLDNNGELSSENGGRRPVPFRLTGNLTELFTPYGIHGPFHYSMVAAARALKQNEEKFRAFLKAIFFDELTYWMVFRKEMSGSIAFSEASTKETEPGTSAKAKLPTSFSDPNLQALVAKGVKKILHDLNEVSQFNGHDSALMKLIHSAKNPDNLCRMDPSWHPWL